MLVEIIRLDTFLCTLPPPPPPRIIECLLVTSLPFCRTYLSTSTPTPLPSALTPPHLHTPPLKSSPRLSTISLCHWLTFSTVGPLLRSSNGSSRRPPSLWLSTVASSRCAGLCSSRGGANSKPHRARSHLTSFWCAWSCSSPSAIRDCPWRTG